MKGYVSALDFISDCLTVGNAPHERLPLRSVVTSAHLDWTDILTTANEQLVSPTLWAALRGRSLTSDLPADVGDYLREINRLNRVRNERLRVQTLDAANALNAIGVVPILLKGTASLFLDTYEDPGSRIMVDLDILVPRKDAEDCWNQLCKQGYSPIGCGRDFSRHHHLEPLQRPGDYGTIEIHHDALEENADDGSLTRRIRTHCRPVKNAGVAMCVPDRTSQVLHNILHAAVAHGGYERGVGSLRSLHELALTASQNREPIDWKEIRSWFERSGKTRVLDSWLYVAHRLFGCQLPTNTRPTPSAIGYYARYRMQARWPWIDAVARRTLLFSARNIQERYGCDNSFTSLSNGRLRLFLDVSGYYGKRLARWCKQYVSPEASLDSSHKLPDQHKPSTYRAPVFPDTEN